MSGVNYYQSAFNSEKEKLSILAEMLEISKSEEKKRGKDRKREKKR